MKVIITQRFEKEFLFPLKKYFTTEDLVLALKNKRYWENITWNNNEKLIELEFDLSVRDIENWNFNEY